MSKTLEAAVRAPFVKRFLGAERPTDFSFDNDFEQRWRNAADTADVVARGANCHLGLGLVDTPTQITSGGTRLLKVGTDNPVQDLNFGAGAGAYTYNIDLDRSAGGKHFAGAMWLLKITKPASANPTIVVRDGSGGTALVSLNNAVAENYIGIFVFNGSNWVKFAFAKNDL